ncbi:MAG TPA: tetratricopeptide repeat protein [Ohtaekwangia sp.]
MKGLLWLLLMATTAVAQVDSVELLRKELEITESAEGRIDLLNRISHFYSQLSLENAEQFAFEALQEASRIDYQKGIAASYNNLGICYSIRGDYTTGLDYFIKALRIREKLNDVRGTSHLLNNISRLFIYQKEFDKALDYSNRSLRMLQKMDDPKGVGSAYISLGSIYMSKNENDKALKMFSSARDIFVKHRLTNREGWALLKMANACEADAQFDRSLQLCFEAMKLLNPGTDLFNTIELYQTIGSLYTRMDDLKSAKQYLHQAVRLADNGNDSQGRMSSRLKLSEVFKKFGKYDSALYYKDEYLQIHNDIFNAEKANQLATLEKIYQTEKKDQLLELKNQEIESQSVIIITISILLAVLAILGFIIFRYYRDKRRSNIELKKLNREIYEKHEEILTQSEELAQANEEISRMNEKLEREVVLRTEKIEIQNKMLIDYAYSNAHNVRGPLARILGLASLMSREEDASLLKEYNTFIYVSAQELDSVIRDINLRLQGD